MSTNADNAIKYGVLSVAAYGENVAPLGWELLLPALNDSNTGFSARAFRNVLTGEVVVSYRGSDDRKDWTGSNVDLFFQQKPETLQLAVKFYNEVKDTFGGTPIVTGHSLGGALAQLVAALESTTGYAFNAPGVLSILKRFEGHENDTAAQYSEVSSIGV